jgi:hypothetical protein
VLKVANKANEETKDENILTMFVFTLKVTILFGSKVSMITSKLYVH